jgi:hypothetical protein
VKLTLLQLRVIHPPTESGCAKSYSQQARGVKRQMNLEDRVEEPEDEVAFLNSYIADAIHQMNELRDLVQSLKRV